MAEPFKELVNAEAAARLGGLIAAAWPAFPLARFVEAATVGLSDLELKARVVHVAGVLRSHLPPAWPDAVAVLAASLPPPLPDDTEVSQGFFLWPLLQVVQDHGLAHPAESLALLREMTKRFSAEFAVRPYLLRHPELAWGTLAGWATDPDVHVRRLVSEGTRPRLPWGQRLSIAEVDVRRGLALLDRLVDDPSAYVRRSVANHLGDVAKDHPALALSVAARWLAERPERRPLVTHALRHLLKGGDAEALRLLDLAGAEVEVGPVVATPHEVRVGQAVTVSASIRARSAGTVRVDVVWQWPALRGGWSSRTFRGADRELAAGATWEFSSSVSTRPVSTRPTRPGSQRLILRVNGADQEPVGFELVPVV